MRRHLLSRSTLKCVLLGGRALSASFFLLYSGVCFSQSPEINLVEFLYANSYDGRAHKDGFVMTYRHIKTWGVGDNFFFVDFSDVGRFSESGSTYVEWGPRLSLGKVFNNAPLTIGVIGDFYLVGEINYSRTKFGENTTPLAGLSVDLRIPGFRVLKTHLEYRDDPDISGHASQVTTIYNYPINIGSWHFAIEGFLDFVKGEADRADSVHAQPQIVWYMNDTVNLGLEWQYWHNKLGRQGLTESVVQGMIRINF